ncbi:serine hydrolase domain-containing protein [Skermanella stibiiresistens]|uniref:serine hydrolase domain-containing protein n=1 Tax=Skermanella stibiiresistens TaxID=913326 RepID=UPI0004B583AC|nr:serine hydrolase [Skermanella stibiiresistens]
MQIKLALSTCLLVFLTVAPAQAARSLDPGMMEETLQRAAAFPALRSLIVARDGVPVIEQVFRGPGLDQPVNIKSISKTIIAALTGVAIDRGEFEGVDQPIVALLGGRVPASADPRLRRVTVDHLLSMRAGLERTSGPFYGRWVGSRDWVSFALARPFVDEPGGGMLYSTGNSHILSAALTRTTGRDTLALARDWLGEPLGIQIPAWQRDPQGIYFGGNNMLLSPRDLLRFGELYRNGGVVDGRRVLSERWIDVSWTPRARSVHTGDAYGYGWFITEARGHPVYYAWGFGGQMIHVIPDLGLTAVITSDTDSPSGRTGYARELHDLIGDGIVRAAEQAP